jgi:hypothetical protein
VHSARALRIHLSAEQVAHGACGGISTVFMLSLAKIASKILVNRASRSRISRGKDLAAHRVPMIRLRAC